MTLFTFGNGEVVWDFPTFEAIFPPLALVSAQAAAWGWMQATTRVSNRADSVVRDLTVRAVVLYNLAAFYVVLGANAASSSTDPVTGQTSFTPGTVGRVTNAHEGSVGIGVAGMGGAGFTEDFLCQNQYGATAWAALQPYLTGPYDAPAEAPWYEFPWP